MGLFKKFNRKVFGKRASKWISNPLRALQRSHKFGKLGHTVLPSNSEHNLVTKAYNKLMSNMSRSALRAAERQAANSPAANSASAAVQTIPQQRLDYGYRRLADLT